MKRFEILLNEKAYLVEVTRISSDGALVQVNGVPYEIGINDLSAVEMPKMMEVTETPVDPDAGDKGRVTPAEKAAIDPYSLLEMAKILHRLSALDPSMADRVRAVKDRLVSDFSDFRLFDGDRSVEEIARAPDKPLDESVEAPSPVYVEPASSGSSSSSSSGSSSGGGGQITRHGAFYVCPYCGTRRLTRAFMSGHMSMSHHGKPYSWP